MAIILWLGWRPVLSFAPAAAAVSSDRIAKTARCVRTRKDGEDGESIQGCAAPAWVALFPGSARSSCRVRAADLVGNSFSRYSSHVQRLAAGNEWRQFEPLPWGIDLGGDGLVHPAVKGMA
ncbi:hypothetical protein [Dyella sp. Tek66A03]|uniref:hypothetical protein n=1 Tax=Dyella sp. Tek66A03 TaxID=3458298 RepID=UPI00403EE54C